jgi:hypothetical protein
MWAPTTRRYVRRGVRVARSVKAFWTLFVAAATVTPAARVLTG